MPEAQKNNDTDTKDTAPDANTRGGEVTESTTPAEAETQSATAQENQGTGRGFIGFIAFVALIVAISAFVAGYIRLQEISAQQAALGQRIDTSQTRIGELESGAESIRTLAKQVRETSQSTQGRLDSLADKLGGLEGKLNRSLDELRENDSALQQSLDTLRQALKSGNNDDLLVAEARHLINIAHHQAQLNHNAAAAAAALEAANQRLGDADDPALLEVRKTITDDIIALRNVAAPDISAIALTLAELEDEVDGLPLRHEEADDAPSSAAQTEQAQVSGVGGFFSKIWSDLKGLVSVRRNSAADTALLPPGQRFFLQQNLRLKLEAARLALMQRDTQSFRTSLETARQWLQRYFNAAAPSTDNMIATLSSYEALELQPELPDVSAALRALKDWREQRQSAAGEEVNES